MTIEEIIQERVHNEAIRAGGGRLRLVERVQNEASRAGLTQEQLAMRRRRNAA